MSCCYMTVCKNTPCPDLEHQLQRLNGQEAYDAKQTSRIRFYGGAFVTEHASKCPQVITHSLSMPFWEVSSTTLLRHPPCWVPLEASEKSLSCSQLWWNCVKATELAAPLKAPLLLWVSMGCQFFSLERESWLPWGQCVGTFKVQWRRCSCWLYSWMKPPGKRDG